MQVLESQKTIDALKQQIESMSTREIVNSRQETMKRDTLRKVQGLIKSQLSGNAVENHIKKSDFSPNTDNIEKERNLFDLECKSLKLKIDSLTKELSDIKSYCETLERQVQ